MKDEFMRFEPSLLSKPDELCEWLKGKFMFSLYYKDLYNIIRCYGEYEPGALFVMDCYRKKGPNDEWYLYVDAMTLSMDNSGLIKLSDISHNRTIREEFLVHYGYYDKKTARYIMNRYNAEVRNKFMKRIAIATKSINDALYEDG